MAGAEEVTGGWSVCTVAPTAGGSHQRPERVAHAPAAAGAPGTPRGPGANPSLPAQKPASTPATSAKARAIPHSVLKNLAQAMLVARAGGRIPRPGEGASILVRARLGAPEKDDVRELCVVEAPPSADLFTRLLTLSKSKFADYDANKAAETCTSMCSKQAKQTGAAAVIVKLGEEMPKKNKTTEEHRYMAGGQPSRWRGFVVKGVAYLDLGLDRSGDLFRAHFDAFRKFVGEAYTEEALAEFKDLELNQQMDLFEDELAALHVAYTPWQTGNDFPQQLHPFQQAHRAANERVADNRQPASNTRTRDAKVLEAANLAAANVHAELAVDTAVAACQAMLAGDHHLYNFLVAVKEIKDRLKAEKQTTQTGARTMETQSTAATSPAEDAMDLE